MSTHKGKSGATGRALAHGVAGGRQQLARQLREARAHDGEVSPDVLQINDPRIIARPDGFHWISEDGRIETGPFATAHEAWADMHGAEAGAPEPGEALEEAEAEIGLATWVDPETGAPAEDGAPRLPDE